MLKADLQFREQSSKSDATEDYELQNNVLQDVFATWLSPSPAACRLEHLTSKLQKIDEQLLAIQNIAENIEQDFPRHGMLNQHCDKVDCLYFSSLFIAKLLDLQGDITFNT